MDISIIICTHNNAESLARTLDSFSTLVIPDGAKAEMLLVDNASEDDTSIVARRSKLKNLEFRYLHEARKGKSNGLNAALARARGQVMLFTDDDVLVPSDWPRAMCDPILQGKGHAVAGHVKLAPLLERKWMALQHRSWFASTERLDPNDPNDMVGASMAFHRSVLERIPGFDTELGPGALGFGEDTLFSEQLRHSGWNIRMSQGDPVAHHFQEERLLRKTWLAIAERMGRSKAYVDYHWRHQRPTRIHVRFYAELARYYFWRTLKRRECSAAEGIPLWELIRLERLHRLRHFIALRNRPRNYEKHGLVKRPAV
jgi:glycosyltransferase involved in cell wall biosynthesis